MYTPFDPTYQRYPSQRYPIYARGGMVNCSSPQAAAAGLEALRRRRQRHRCCRCRRCGIDGGGTHCQRHRLRRLRPGVVGQGGTAVSA